MNTEIRKEEYNSLRNEIMLRIGWNHAHTHRAVTIFLAVWSGCIMLLAYVFAKDAPQSLTGFGISLPTLSAVGFSQSALMLALILIFLSFAVKIHENLLSICNICAYLRKFHEKLIWDSNNHEPYFGWERGHLLLRIHFHNKMPWNTRLVNHFYNEVSFLSGLSLIWCVLILGIGLWKIVSIWTLVISILIIMIIGGVLIRSIHKLSSLSCMGPLQQQAYEFLKQLSDPTHSSTTEVNSH